MLVDVLFPITRVQRKRRKRQRNNWRVVCWPTPPESPQQSPSLSQSPSPFYPTNGSQTRIGKLAVAIAALLGAVLVASGCVKAQGPVVQSGGGNSQPGQGQSQGANQGNTASASANQDQARSNTSTQIGTSPGVEAQPGYGVVEAIRKGPVQANGTVTHLVDGDTVDVAFLSQGATFETNGKTNGKTSGKLHTERIRLIGIDTPETKRPNTPVECFGKEASSALAALIPIGTPVMVERDVEERDRYGRLLGYVFRASDGLFVNHEMVRAGMALPYTFPPNIAYVDVFADAGDASRAAAAGLWSRCESGHTPAN
jgi:micrococcal nuclease